MVSSLGFLSPVSAVLLGWALLDQRLSAAQMAGMAIVVASVWLSQHVQRRAALTGAGVPAGSPRTSAPAATHGARGDKAG